MAYQKAVIFVIWSMVIIVDLFGDDTTQPPQDPPRATRELWEL